MEEREGERERLPRGKCEGRVVGNVQWCALRDGETGMWMTDRVGIA